MSLADITGAGMSGIIPGYTLSKLNLAAIGQVEQTLISWSVNAAIQQTRSSSRVSISLAMASNIAATSSGDPRKMADALMIAAAAVAEVMPDDLRKEYIGETQQTAEKRCRWGHPEFFPLLNGADGIRLTLLESAKILRPETTWEMMGELTNGIDPMDLRSAASWTWEWRDPKKPDPAVSTDSASTNPPTGPSDTGSPPNSVPDLASVISAT